MIQVIKNTITPLLLFGLALCLNACGYFPLPCEPAKRGDVAPVYFEPWPVPPACSGMEECNQVPEISPNHDLTPYELVDIALQNNPKTRQSWQTARAAAYQVGINASTLYPSVATTETAILEFISPGGATTPINGQIINTGGGATGGTGAASQQDIPVRAMNYQLMINYLAWDFGGRVANIEAARQALRAANWTHNRNLQTIMSTVLQAYYNFINAKGVFTARELNLKDSYVNLEAAKAFFKAGTSTILDLLQAESNYANAELQLETARGNVFTTHGQLATAMGLKSDAEFAVVNIPDELPLNAFDEDIDSLLAIAADQRPDLAAAYSTFLEQKELITVARSQGLPTLTANVNLQKTNFVHNPSVNSHVYAASLSLNVPIFAGFLYINEERQARANAAAAYYNFLSIEESAFLDVSTAYYAYKTAVEAIKYSDEYLKYSQEAYNAAYTTYREGTGSMLDVIVATDTLANARVQWVQARTQLFISVVNVAYALGTL